MKEDSRRTEVQRALDELSSVSDDLRMATSTIRERLHSVMRDDPEDRSAYCQDSPSLDAKPQKLWDQIDQYCVGIRDVTSRLLHIIDSLELPAGAHGDSVSES